MNFVYLVDVMKLYALNPNGKSPLGFKNYGVLV